MQESVRIPGLVSKAIILAIAIAMALPAGALLFADAAEVPVETSIVRVTVSDAAQVEALREAGADIVVDYGNGIVLTRVTNTQAIGLENMGFNTDDYSDRTLLDTGSSKFLFDTSEGIPQLSNELTHPGYAAGETGHYYVQFVGPAMSDWETILETQGVNVEQWVGGNVALVTMNSNLKSSVENLAIVEWVGVYQPAFKIAYEELSAEGDVYVSAFTYENGDVYQLADKISQTGVSIREIDANYGYVWFSCDVSMLPTIAQMEEVSQILHKGIAYPNDLVAGEVHFFHHAWYTSWSGLDTTLTGTGQILHIQDTGFDEGDANNGHCDFFENGDRVISFADRTGNSVPDGLEGGVSHGTHCAGISLQDGWCWETANGITNNDDEWHEGEAGVAPEGQLVMDGCAQGAGLSVSVTYCDQAYTSFNAYVSSNSWGGDPSNYGGDATAVDTSINGNNARMIVFAAGNAGPDPETMDDAGYAKNGLSIGASENFRPDQFSSDNPSIVADFSSRGGPTQGQGRIAPDLLATGTSVVSAFSRGEWDYNVGTYGNPQPSFIMDVDEYNYLTKNPGVDNRPDYQYMQGTSMACPMAAGTYLLTREYFTEVHSIATPSSQLCKAILINGADHMNAELFEFPGYDQGWGRINLKNSLFPDAPTTNQFEEATMTTTSTWTPSGMNLNVNSDEVPLIATLVWVDTAGVNLARNLDLQLISPSGVTYNGNDYVDGLTVPDGGVTDNNNNIEQVNINSPEEGLWQLSVTGIAIPSAAPFAVVFAADIGPIETYQPDLSTQDETTFSTVAGGHSSMVISLKNFGTSADTITLGENGPFSWSLTPTSPYSLASDESVDITVEFSAAGVPVGVYDFQITATSGGDASQDSLNIRGQVLDNPLPKTINIASSDADEKDPSVLTFNDGTTDWIFVTFIKATTAGNRVFVQFTTLGGDNEPVFPWTGPIEIAPAPEGDYYWPNDPRIDVVRGGAYQDRVFISFTADDANTDPDYASSSYMAHADAPYTSWYNSRSDINSGMDNMNYKRVAFMLLRETQIIQVFEHLDYQNEDTMTGVDTHMVVSTDGGDSWGAALQVAPGDGNYYFFPNGCVDNNDVGWIFFYWRTPSGNDRDLRVRLWDGAFSAAVDVWDTTDNVQFPAPTATGEGGGNRVYCAVTRDNLGTDLNMWTTYIDGTYSSGTPPPTSTNGWGNTEGPFGGAISDANYNRRPVLCPVGTDDGWTWLPYMEKNQPYGDVNMYSILSSDGFASTSTSIITADTYAKGHQMADTLTIGASNNLYEVFHASHGSYTEVNYDIYLIIYHYDWENDPDVYGPVVQAISANPNPITDLGTQTTVTVVASLFDVELNGITNAEYIETATDISVAQDVVWTGSTAMSLSGGTASESATGSISTASWRDGEVHRVWVRARDNQGNWGDDNADYIDIEVGEPVAWLLQTEASAIGGYFNLSDEMLGAGNVASVELTSAGEFQVGGEWMTDTFLTAQDISGTWLFKAYGYLTTNQGAGQLYAKVYRYNGGAPAHLFTTGYDDQEIQNVQSMNQFVWSYDAPSITVSAGDRIYVEYWVHATAGKVDDQSINMYEYSNTAAGSEPHDAYECMIDAAPFPTTVGGNLNSKTEGGDADYNAIFTSNNADWITVRPGQGDESMVWFDFTITEAEGDVYRLNTIFEGAGTAGGGGMCILNYDSNTWEDTASVTFTGTTTDITPTAYKMGDVTPYISAGGVVSFCTWGAANRGYIYTDYAALEVIQGSPAPTFTMGYDAASTPSGVTPPYAIALGTPVGPGGDAPVADAGTDQNGFVDYNCQFDGSGTTEADGDAVTYTWTFDDGGPVVLNGVNPVYLFTTPGNYEVTLTASDVDGSDVDTMWVNVDYVTHDIVVGAGWNFISYAVDTTGMNMDVIFADEWANINAIMTYDNVAKSWLSYHDTTPTWLNDLTSVDCSMGLWVNFDSAAVLSVQGKLLTSTTVNLYSGWNMVGYPTLTADTANNVLTGTGFTMLQQYDNGAPYLISDMAGGSNMVAGGGYWVFVPADTSYVVAY